MARVLETAEFYTQPGTLYVGGLPIVRLTSEQMCQVMVHDTARARTGLLKRPRVITSANGNTIAMYHSQSAFRALIDQMDVINADGMPLVVASRLFCTHPLPERLATTDFILDASRTAARSDLRFYFLGARPGVAARAADHLRAQFPGLQVVGTRHGYFEHGELAGICAEVRESGADVLWLGLGCGLQEAIALECRDQLPGLGWIHTCGGLFDYYGAGVSRAPVWMRKAALEWAYRGAREPLRLGWRYLTTNPSAFWHLATKTHD
ncbi:WecB/TagA/CpsF family glycosyltransferase [Novosphingobium soli]|uniref:WecB/TagA/CpsF family glycosyltransferase n=1 Tax=Novosphingobium soli TaxID=574956 RepID=A0ABV6CWZ4_9SPHN